MDEKENPKGAQRNSDGPLRLLFASASSECWQHSDDAEDERVVACGSGSNAKVRQVMSCVQLLVTILVNVD